MAPIGAFPLHCAPMLRRIVLLITLSLTAAAQSTSAPAATATANDPGMHVILLGTGAPRPYPDRAGPCTAIVVNRKVFFVDAGRGVMMRVAGAHLPFDTVTAVFLTHLHSDHTNGLPDLFSTTWIFGRATPLQLHGPTGTQKLADAMVAFFAEDIHIRRDLTEMQPAAGATVDVHEVKEGVVYRDDDVTVTAFEVDHRPVVPAFGYRFNSGGKVIVVSGDTAPSENLVKFAKGADILVHEVYSPRVFSRFDNPQVAARLSRYHTDAEQVGKIAAEAGVKMLVLTHVIPPEESDKIRELAAKNFKGEIVVGKDLMRF
jgi:ribonuclease Z